MTQLISTGPRVRRSRPASKEDSGPIIRAARNQTGYSQEARSILYFDWERFLRGLSGLAGFPSSQAETVQRLWTLVKGARPTIGPPKAQANDDGSFSMCWDYRDHHLEVELLASGECDWFYWNRATDETDDGAVIPFGQIPDALRRHLFDLGS